VAIKKVLYFKFIFMFRIKPLTIITSNFDCPHLFSKVFVSFLKNNL
jgi:hypothetical protein